VTETGPQRLKILLRAAVFLLVLAGPVAWWLPSPALAVPPQTDEVSVHAAQMVKEQLQRFRETEVEKLRAKVVQAMLAGDRKTAKRLGAKANDPVLDKLTQWIDLVYLARADYFENAGKFLEQNRGWPRASRIGARIEADLYKTPRPAEQMLAYLTANPPRTVAGKLALARAHRLLGDDARAVEIVREVWRGSRLSAGAEKAIFKRYKDHITKADHLERLERHIYRGHTSAATRQARKLSKAHVTMTKAAVALLKRHRRAMKSYRKVTKALVDNPALQFALAKYWHKRKKYAQARKVVVKIQAAHPKLPEPQGWWSLRVDLARNGLARNNKDAWHLAYAIIKGHGYSTGGKFVQGEFLAGWIALRFLKQPKAALKHFQTLRAGDDRPLNIAQAEYWLGRTYEALYRYSAATEHFKAAASYRRIFYGQLARAHLGLGELEEQPEMQFVLRHDAIDSVYNHELLQAARLLKSAGRPQLARSFVLALAKLLHTREKRTALALLSKRLEGPQLAVRVGKLADQLGTAIGEHAYPQEVPDYKTLRPGVEPALLYSLIRQESEFDPEAVSHAGARGLMQIMPATAKLLARRHKQKYSVSKLTETPSYNLSFGTALLHDLVNTFNGSYIMALGGYNAGPGRVLDWNRRYGDPRKGQLDPVDWIEAIPFNETRNYIKRVMENVQIYRFHLRSTEIYSLAEDLRRGEIAKPEKKRSDCMQERPAGLVSVC